MKIISIKKIKINYLIVIKLKSQVDIFLNNLFLLLLIVFVKFRIEIVIIETWLLGTQAKPQRKDKGAFPWSIERVRKWKATTNLKVVINALMLIEFPFPFYRIYGELSLDNTSSFLNALGIITCPSEVTLISFETYSVSLKLQRSI